MIELKGIVREYRNGDIVTPALTGIDLCIGKGEFAAVMGASGSGKTTLLHIMAAWTPPPAESTGWTGSIWNGRQRSVSRRSGDRRSPLSFSILRCWRTGTAAENVALPLLRQRMSGAERRATVLAALEQVGIADLAHRKPSQLSADRSSAPPSPGRWCAGRIFCWQMSPPARWTAGPGRRLWVCSRS